MVQVPPGEHPSSGRFLVKDYPKDKEYRRLKLSAQITAKILAHIQDRGLGADDLLFSYQTPDQSATRRRTGVIRTAGLTDPDAHGRRYRRGPSSWRAGQRRSSEWDKFCPVCSSFLQMGG